MKPVHAALVVFTAAAAIQFLGCGDATAPARKGPSYSAIRITEPPVVDGLLTDACWERAAVQPFVATGGGDPRFATNFRAVWDSTALYIGFECQDTDAAATAIGRDVPLDDGEYVTIMLDPVGNGRTFAVISIAPTGAVADAFVLRGVDGRRQRIPGWDAETMRASVTVYGGGARPETEDRFWTVEAALPFTDFLTAPELSPSPGSAWRFTALRHDITEGQEISAIDPAGADMPDAFPWLVFAE